jgi:hypothetical protein
VLHKEDTQISYLEFIKMLHQLLGNYILMECQIMKIYDCTGVGDFLRMIARPVSFLFRHVHGRFGFLWNVIPKQLEHPTYIAAPCIIGL